MYKIVKEHWGKITRYYVIKEPIIETGICKEFTSYEAAQQYVKEQEKLR